MVAAPPNLQVSSEPCSACGRSDSYFSKRQMQVDAAIRKCIECMPSRGGQVPAVPEPGAEHPPPFEKPPLSQPSPQSSPDPCSACRRYGMLFSKRQMQVEAHRRRCLECMPGRDGPKAQAPAWIPAQPAAYVGAAQAPAWIPAQPAAYVGAAQTAYREAPTWIPAQPAAYGGAPSALALENAPKPSVAAEPCAGCGRPGALYSKRQMKFEPGKRKCLDCMPSHNSELTAQAVWQATDSGAAISPQAFEGAEGPLNLPKPCSAPEPCSGCGQMGVLFSKRQMQVEPSRRRCLTCLPPRVGGGHQTGSVGGEDLAARPRTVPPPPLVPRLQATPPHVSAPPVQVTSATSSAATPVTNLPNPQTAPEPCSGCGRVGVFFSKRQIQVEPSRRRCLECLPPRVKEVPPQAALAGAGASPITPSMQAPAAGSPVNLPNPQTSAEPCSMCGRQGALFSKRQMAVEASRRRCLDCLPPRVTVPGAGVMQAPAAVNAVKKRKFSEVAQKIVAAGVVPPKVKGPEAPPPKENIAEEPCSACGRTGMSFSNRQMKVDAAQRMCIECMDDQRKEKRARVQEEATPPALT